MSGMSILTGVVMLGSSAFAVFSSQATADVNTFSSGNAELLISLNGTDFDTSVNNPFNGTNIAPGYSNPFTFYLKNTSDSAITLALSTTFANVIDSGLSSELTSQITCTNDTTTTVTVGGTFSITSMNGGNVSLGSLGPGERATCVATFALPLSSTAANSGVKFDAIFNGVQQ